MIAHAEASRSPIDLLKLAGAALLVAGGIWSFYLFGDQSLLLRVGGLLAILAIGAAISLTTTPGRRLLRFASDARMELRKIVWPSRQETVQTTLVVIVMVILLSLVLWLFDSLLMATLRLLTG